MSVRIHSAARQANEEVKEKYNDTDFDSLLRFLLISANGHAEPDSTLHAIRVERGRHAALGALKKLTSVDGLSSKFTESWSVITNHSNIDLHSEEPGIVDGHGNVQQQQQDKNGISANMRDEKFGSHKPLPSDVALSALRLALKATEPLSAAHQQLVKDVVRDGLLPTLPIRSNMAIESSDFGPQLEGLRLCVMGGWDPKRLKKEVCSLDWCESLAMSLVHALPESQVTQLLRIAWTNLLDNLNTDWKVAASFLTFFKQVTAYFKRRTEEHVITSLKHGTEERVNASVKRGSDEIVFLLFNQLMSRIPTILLQPTSTQATNICELLSAWAQQDQSENGHEDRHSQIQLVAQSLFLRSTPRDPSSLGLLSRLLVGQSAVQAQACLPSDMMQLLPQHDWSPALRSLLSPLLLLGETDEETQNLSENKSFSLRLVDLAMSVIDRESEISKLSPTHATFLINLIQCLAAVDSGTNNDNNNQNNNSNNNKNSSTSSNDNDNNNSNNNNNINNKRKKKNNNKNNNNNDSQLVAGLSRIQRCVQRLLDSIDTKTGAKYNYAVLRAKIAMFVVLLLWTERLSSLGISVASASLRNERNSDIDVTMGVASASGDGSRRDEHSPDVDATKMDVSSVCGDGSTKDVYNIIVEFKDFVECWLDTEEMANDKTISVRKKYGKSNAKPSSNRTTNEWDEFKSTVKYFVFDNFISLTNLVRGPLAKHLMPSVGASISQMLLECIRSDTQLLARFQATSIAEVSMKDESFALLVLQSLTKTDMREEQEKEEEQQQQQQQSENDGTIDADVLEDVLVLASMSRVGPSQEVKVIRAREQLLERFTPYLTPLSVVLNVCALEQGYNGLKRSVWDDQNGDFSTKMAYQLLAMGVACSGEWNASDLDALRTITFEQFDSMAGRANSKAYRAIRALLYSAQHDDTLRLASLALAVFTTDPHTHFRQAQLLYANLAARSKDYNAGNGMDLFSPHNGTWHRHATEQALALTDSCFMHFTCAVRVISNAALGEVVYTSSPGMHTCEVLELLAMLLNTVHQQLKSAQEKETRTLMSVLQTAYYALLCCECTLPPLCRAAQVVRKEISDVNGAALNGARSNYSKNRRGYRYDDASDVVAAKARINCTSAGVDVSSCSTKDSGVGVPVGSSSRLKQPAEADELEYVVQTTRSSGKKKKNNNSTEHKGNRTSRNDTNDINSIALDDTVMMSKEEEEVEEEQEEEQEEVEEGEEQEQEETDAELSRSVRVLSAVDRVVERLKALVATLRESQTARAISKENFRRISRVEQLGESFFEDRYFKGLQ